MYSIQHRLSLNSSMKKGKNFTPRKKKKPQLKGKHEKDFKKSRAEESLKSVLEYALTKQAKNTFWPPGI